MIKLVLLGGAAPPAKVLHLQVTNAPPGAPLGTFVERRNSGSQLRFLGIFGLGQGTTSTLWRRNALAV